MEVFLVQHGEATPESEDPQRPLTERGKAEVEKVARHAAGLRLQVSLILHSDKLRAQQTAEILGRYLVPPQGVREQMGLAPTDGPRVAEELIRQAAEPIMLVGHLPHLSRLTSLLILGSPEKEVIRFRNGGIVCLSRDESAWAVRWILTPELIQGN
jgi:phosphohistidine phosphatase